MLLAALAVIAGAVVYWMEHTRRRSARAVRQAGSPPHVEPVGPMRLVAAMEPGDDTHPRQGPLGAVDPSSVSDTKILVDVKMKLGQMNLPVDRIDIEVEDRRVLLEGRVDDALVRDAIEVTARSVPGVRQVVNRLQIVGQQ